MAGYGNLQLIYPKWVMYFRFAWAQSARAERWRKGSAAKGDKEASAAELSGAQRETVVSAAGGGQ